VDRAFATFSEFRNFDVEANLFTYNVLLEILSKSWDRRLVNPLLEEMRSKGLRRDAETFNTLITIALTKKSVSNTNENLHDGFKLVRDAKSEGVKLLPSSYAFLAREMSKSGFSKESQEVLQMMEAEGYKIPNFLRRRVRALEAGGEESDWEQLQFASGSTTSK